MNLIEFEQVEGLKYNEYCNYLLKKYGAVPYNYFDEKYNKIVKNSRTAEGLFVHHIKEDVVPNLSDPDNAETYNFDFQLKENLIYCDWLEHLFLHILISEEKNNGLGINGALIILELIAELYNGKEIQKEWVQNCFNKIKNDEEAFDLLCERYDAAEEKVNEHFVLLEHNTQVYNELELYLQNDNKALVDLGTGLGKTTTALEYLHQNNIRGLVLCPTKLIQDSWKEYSEVDTMTYAGFANKFNTIDYSKYGVVICDEAHHCGGATWGKGPKYLIDNNIIKVIGLTATPIRTDGIDIGQTLFGGNICQGHDVLKGIEDGILHSFSYISAIYDTEKIREKYNEENIDNELRGELDLALNNTPTVKNILIENMPEGKRKGIVFVSNIKAIKEAYDIMYDIYPNVEYRAIHSKMSEQEIKENKKWFKNTDEGFLISIDMISEGAHYSGVNTLIMFRHTSSALVFNQQLGRVISLAKYQDPNAVVFDFVNNADNIEEIESFSSKLKNTLDIIQERKKKKGEKSKQRIIKSYCQDIVNVLKKIILSSRRIRPVICLETKKIYSSIKEAARNNQCSKSSIQQCCQNKYRIAGNYHWQFLDEICLNQNNLSNIDFNQIIEDIGTPYKKVYCLETKEIFNNIHDAERKYNIAASSIVKCCKKRLLSSGGLHWCYYEDKDDISVEKIEHIRKKPGSKSVYCVELKQIFNSASEAERYTKVERHSIGKCCKGQAKTAGGFHWEYVEGEEND